MNEEVKALIDTIQKKVQEREAVANEIADLEQDQIDLDVKFKVLEERMNDIEVDLKEAEEELLEAIKSHQY